MFGKTSTTGKDLARLTEMEAKSAPQTAAQDESLPIAIAIATAQAIKIQKIARSDETYDKLKLAITQPSRLNSEAKKEYVIEPSHITDMKEMKAYWDAHLGVKFKDKKFFIISPLPNRCTVVHAISVASAWVYALDKGISVPLCFQDRETLVSLLTVAEKKFIFHIWNIAAYGLLTDRFYTDDINIYQLMKTGKSLQETFNVLFTREEIIQIISNIHNHSLLQDLIPYLPKGFADNADNPQFHLLSLFSLTKDKWGEKIVFDGQHDYPALHAARRNLWEQVVKIAEQRSRLAAAGVFIPYAGLQEALALAAQQKEWGHVKNMMAFGVWNLLVYDPQSRLSPLGLAIEDITQEEDLSLMEYLIKHHKSAPLTFSLMVWMRKASVSGIVPCKLPRGMAV